MTPADLSGLWFGYRDVAVGWLERTPWKNAFAVHYAVRPDHRGRYWPVHRALEEMARAAYAEAQEVGILFVPGGTAAEPYLERLGFVWDAACRLWCYRFGEET